MKRFEADGVHFPRLAHEFSKKHVGDCGGFVGGLDKLGVKGGLGLRGFLVITSVSWGDELCAQPFLMVTRVLAKAGSRAMSGSTRIPGWMPRSVTSWSYGRGMMPDVISGYGLGDCGSGLPMGRKEVISGYAMAPSPWAYTTITSWMMASS